MRARDHVTEGAEIVFAEPALHGREYTVDLAAAAQYLGVIEDVLRFRDAREGYFLTLQTYHVLGILFGRDQFIVAAAHELQQIVQKLGNIGGANVMFETQLAHAAAEVYPQILVVEHAKIFVDALEHVEAVIMEGSGVHFSSAKQLAHTVAHLAGRVE